MTRKASSDARYRAAFEFFVTHQAETLDEAAKMAGLNASAMRNVAAKNKWTKRRDAIDERAQQRADEALARRTGDRLARFREETLQLADSLKVKALEALASDDPNKAMTQADAVKAIRAAVSIQATALGLDRGKAPSDEGGLTLQQIVINGGTPAGLNPGDVALELTDDELARIASKPRIIEPAPRPAPARLEGPGGSKRGPGHSGKRAAAPAPGKG